MPVGRYKLNQIKSLINNFFLINMTTWEDSPDMLFIAATIKRTNTVLPLRAQNSPKDERLKWQKVVQRISTMSSQQSN